MASAEQLQVEVAWAEAQRQEIVRLTVPAGTTIAQAIHRSGILEQFPGISLSSAAVGIFGEPARQEDVVQSGDRIEIYRPLQADPKQARRRRAAVKKRPAG
jgi:hypothetical protein